ncbi:hypothetical protein [Actinomadura keratinilytica]|uniref:Uncharacterized protein n=1 Tax=Actinomadura keratinilytica TaxID=547461 RepID=A0ABP7YD72_9ACTN
MPRHGANGAHGAVRKGARRAEKRSAGRRWTVARIGGGVAGAALGRMAGRMLAPLARGAARRLGLPPRAVTWLVQTAAPVVASLAAERMAVRRSRRDRDAGHAPGGRAAPRHGTDRRHHRPRAGSGHGPRHSGEPPGPVRLGGRGDPSRGGGRRPRTAT